MVGSLRAGIGRISLNQQIAVVRNSCSEIAARYFLSDRATQKSGGNVAARLTKLIAQSTAIAATAVIRKRLHATSKNNATSE
jgi:hypothetical protein